MCSNGGEGIGKDGRAIYEGEEVRCRGMGKVIDLQAEYWFWFWFYDENERTVQTGFLSCR